ncbi:MAG: gluconate 2-dehydrogenase subunit 3 family protein [Acidobacteriota bacterium]
MTRREAAAAMAAFVLPLEAQGPADAPKLGFFTPNGAKLIEIIANVFIPPDEFPGAAEAGVVFYIDKQMQGPLKHKLEVWRAGLFTFSSVAKHQFEGRSFLLLKPEEQKLFLDRIAEGHIPALRPIFDLIYDLTLQGYFGSPEHGGNLNQTSWKMLRVEDVMNGSAHNAHVAPKAGER